MGRADRENIGDFFVCLFASAANAEVRFRCDAVCVVGEVVFDELFFS
jgi:hypothetical protein